MVRAWNRDSKWHEWHVLSVEKSFEVWTGYAKRMMGKIDGIILHPLTGKAVPAGAQDHSPVGVWMEPTTSTACCGMSNQPIICMPYQKMLDDGTISGECADGVFTTSSRSPLSSHTKPPRWTSANIPKMGICTPTSMRLTKPQEHSGKGCASGTSRKTAAMKHTCIGRPAQIAEQIKDFNLTLKDIVAAERDQTYYRNPANCSVLPCPYAPKCLEDRPDTDCLFVKKEARNEELI